MSAPDRSSRILGSLWGSLAGDALGVPVEFQTRADIARNPVTGMRGYGTHGQPAGTWSDDSSLLLCTVESLAERGGYDPGDLGTRFVQWKQMGHWTPHGRVFDIGIATSQALSRLAAGDPPEQAGGAGENSNGNGSVMRIAPIGLWFAGAGPASTIERAQRASALTHRHPRSQMACALYCLVIRELLSGAAPAEALHSALQQWPESPERVHFSLLESGDLAGRPEREIESSGYVVHTLIASLWCLLTSRSFEETVLKAVNLGLDTDTTGTVAGGLAGACYGLKSIPSEWKYGLARHDAVADLFTTFLSRLP